MVFAYFLVVNYKTLTWFSNKIVQILSFLTTSIILVRTNPANLLAYGPNSDPRFNILWVLFLAFFLYGSYLFYHSSAFEKFGRIYLILLGVVFGFLVILVFEPSDPRDYGFYLGPALKLIQGEKLDSFYMQYNLLGTYLFKWMMDLGFKLIQMELTLRIIFIFWFFLYYKLATKLIKENFLVFLFMTALVTLRFLSLMRDPVFNAQITPIRLDLWVPLLFIVYKFGFFSPITAVVFAFNYVLDNFIGFLYLIGYLLMIALLFCIRKYRNQAVNFQGLFFLALPIIVSVVFQLYFFGSLLSPAGKIYRDINYGLIPILPHSMFWVIIAILPVYLYLVLKEESIKYQLTSLFLLILALLQLVYFYGRSHENNILNISGIFLLILFMCFDKLIKLNLARSVIYVVASLFILLSASVFAKFAFPKLSLAYSHLSHGKLIETHPLDKVIDNNPDLFSVYPSEQKIFVMSNYDSYFNYRYHFDQKGWFTPFVANVYLDDTVKLLKDMVSNGYKVVLWEQDMVNSVSEFNKSKYLIDQGLRFSLKRQGPLLLELRINEASNSSKLD